jgi:photosystem II stability/assembly factor-like uncharacterized protein
MKKLIIAACLSVSLVVPVGAQQLEKDLSAAVFRSIGPFRGGRANGAAGVVGDPLTYYMATTGGGLWKTTDAGHRWFNISDGYFKTGSMGAVAVSESHPNVVYAGMGEHAPRGVMTSYGDGVYKSTDGGKTWKHLGLEATRQISRISIHPDNPDIVFVAAQGALNGPTKERGIYKSTDGGKTWQHTLFVNETTGCSDLSIDMHNPDVLYAAMWDHDRKPWEVRSGGPGSGLYKSTDGGLTWNTIHNGIPEEKGKMAIAVSRADSDWVYALVESDTYAEKGGLFLSTNAGNSWSRVSGDHRLIQRAWYYIEVFPDPQNKEKVNVLNASYLQSKDAGKTWSRIDAYHGDYHDLWINPNNPNNMAVADDGGVSITFDGGENWTDQKNMPTAQLYRVAADDLWPYNVYAGQQDNSSLRIATLALGTSGIDHRHWQPAAGGESAFLAFDPKNPIKTMGGSYLGSIDITNMESMASTNIMIEPNLYLGLAARDMKYLFNWNAPIIKSQHEPNTYFHGAQYVLKTTDEGHSWQEISPDLTRNQDEKQGNGGVPYTNEAVGAENYGTLSYIIESPHEAGTMITGSDDGFVHITRDGGKSWQNITPKKLPETLINAIDISPHDKGTIYIATTRYKFNDFSPALYKSTDYGKSWKAISNGIPYGAYTRVVREDPARKDLLFAGTELGLYVSLDGGSNWQPYQRNLPVTPITDLLIKHDDLIIATQGRSFWILDDMNLFRQYDGSSAPKLYAPEPAVMANWYSTMNAKNPSGTSDFVGVNPASGVVLYYSLPELGKDQEVRLEIKDQAGNTVRSFTSKEDPSFVSYEGYPSRPATLDQKTGLNRFVWDMRYETLEGIPGVYIEASFRGHKAIPGTYTATLFYGDYSASVPVEIRKNPLLETTDAQYQEYHEFMSGAEATYNEMTQQVNRLFEKSKKLEKIAVEKELNAELSAAADQLIKDLKTYDAIMAQRLSKAYDDVENYVNGFTANYIRAFNEADSDQPRVTAGTKKRIGELNTEWQKHKAVADPLEQRLKELEQRLFEAGIGPLSF